MYKNRAIDTIYSIDFCIKRINMSSGSGTAYFVTHEKGNYLIPLSQFI